MPGCRSIALIAVVGAALALTVAVPTRVAAHGEQTACLVRNITQHTEGRAWLPMLRASRDGDVLRIRGTCVGGGVIRTDILVQGKGPTPTLTGLGKRRVVQVAADATVRIARLRLVDGHVTFAAGVGGGPVVYNAGRLRLTDVVTREGWTGEYAGGVIANVGTLRLIRTTVRGGVAVWGGAIGNRGTLFVASSRIVRSRASVGGGIWDRGTGTRVVDTVVTRNRAQVGGGIAAEGLATIAVVRGAIMDNHATSRGGGIAKEFRGVLELEGMTVRDNTSDGPGGGIWTRGGALTLIDTTVTDNHAGAPGGGILVDEGTTVVTFVGDSSVSGNTPDDCVGSDACVS